MYCVVSRSTLIRPRICRQPLPDLLPFAGGGAAILLLGGISLGLASLAVSVVAEEEDSAVQAAEVLAGAEARLACSSWWWRGGGGHVIRAWHAGETCHVHAVCHSAAS